MGEQLDSYVRDLPTSEAISIVACTSTAITDWRSVSMDFIFGLAPDSQDRTGILAFVDRFNKMTNLVPVHATITTLEAAAHFVDDVFRHHGLPEIIVSDRDPRFT